MTSISQFITIKNMLTENKSYNQSPLLQGGVSAAYSLGNTLPKRPAQSSKIMNPGQKYPNISQGASQQAPTSAQPLSKLGTETVGYGGSTKFEQFHPGVDIANKIGTPIGFTSPGEVTDVKTGMKQGDKGYGNYVVVKDQYGQKHRYSHLNQVFVKPGDTVTQGQVGMTMGNSGSSYSTHGGTGSHLDYRIYDLYGRYVNPYKYLKEKYASE